MAAETHTRARAWASARLDAEEVGAGATYHLRDRGGRRIRVAGRHIENRQPNFFPLGDTLAGDPFDDIVVVLFDSDWSVSLRLSASAGRGEGLPQAARRTRVSAH